MAVAPRPQAAVNVTPLIDVLLVLLVIFLAALPLSEASLETEIPRETRAAPKAAPDDRVLVEYTAERQLSINQQAVALGSLEPTLRDIYRKRHDKTLYISAAGSLPYAAVVDVIDAAKGAGVNRVGIVTEGMRRAARMRD